MWQVSARCQNPDMEDESRFVEAIPMIKPRKSAAINGHYRLLPHSSSSSSPSSSSSASATPDFDLKSSPMSYTSLKDLIPSSPTLLSPSTPSAIPEASAGGSTLEICIRNRLVKQAAWAYLQPMASSPTASGRRLWNGFMPCLSSLRRKLVDLAANSWSWISDALWLLLCR